MRDADAPNEQPERRKMHPDVERLMEAILSRDDRVTDLQSAMEAMPEQIGKAMQEAILRSASDPAVWGAAGQALQRHARERAGGWLLGGLQSVFTKIAWLLVVGFGIYLIGGWTAFAALWKSAFAHS